MGKYFRTYFGLKSDIYFAHCNKRDFGMFSYEKGAKTSFRLEPIQGVKDHYSIRTGGQWRIFFVWEKNEAWEIEISKHNYKRVRR